MRKGYERRWDRGRPTTARRIVPPYWFVASAAQTRALMVYPGPAPVALVGVLPFGVGTVADGAGVGLGSGARVSVLTC